MKRTILEIKKNRNNILVCLILIITIVMTIGYASYGQLLELNGGISVLPDGKFTITKITLLNSSNILSSDPPIVKDKKVEFNVVFNGKNKEFFISYEIELSNDSSYEYTYNGFNITPNITGTNDSIGTLDAKITNIMYGDKILPKTKKMIILTMKLIPSNSNETYNANIKLDTSINNSNLGQILINVNPKELNLKGNINFVKTQIELMNTYKYPVELVPTIANSNFEIVDINGNIIKNINMQANSTDKQDIYIRKKPNSKFYEDIVNTRIVLTGNNINVTYSDDISIQVDKELIIDKKIPQIGPINWEVKNTEGNARINWTRLDTNGISIKNYTILLYNAKDNSLIKSYTTKGDKNFYAIKKIKPGLYYVKIYGTDKSGNSGKDYVNSADEKSVYCRKSAVVDLKWTFNVVDHMTNLNFSGNKTVRRGSNYTASISPINSSYSIPDTITVKMGNITLTTSQYTYSNGSISIPNVTGDLDITASAINSCLIEGTLITLANGNKKPIESIKYDDLLKVWSYDLGKFVYEYPIWIEKRGSTPIYQKTTFNDGSILNTVGFHGVFSIDLNSFISVDDKENFKIGTNIYKINENKLKKITVTNIEYIHKKVNYYHVVSNRYQNIVANDILTTDGTTILSNVFGFDKNIKWPLSRKETLNNKNNIYNYSEFKDFMPYYMFKGMRIEEGKVLNNFGYISTIDFKNYLKSNQTNKLMLLKPEENTLGKRLWMVTTSDDKIVINKNIYKYQEGMNYMVKSPLNKENFLYWYNTSDNKIYYPGDIIKVWNGIYLEAIYKK